MPHYFFWPFDIGRSKLDRERARAKTHISDAVRIGVLAEDEGAELRIEGHLMGCDVCKEISISLWERAREKGDDPAKSKSSCLRARNAVLRHLEEERPLTEATINHLRGCDSCAVHFIEPAKALHTLDVDEGAVSGQD